MAKDYNPGNYRLAVPLDASEIEGFKPEKGVKVGVLERSGKIHSQIVRLDAKGHGVANFNFSEKPGALRLIVGPEDASDEELSGLQTLSANVAVAHWESRNDLQLSAIRITPYYWWWWWWWCRTYTINGRVLCPDGSPVPGAVVCAYDVDWWWWWISQQQVGNCVTTDATGSFTITFRRCCGWWPWWWWRYRYWSYEPILAEQILAVLRRDPALGRLQAPSPVPDLSIFDHLLSEGSTLERRLRAASPVDKSGRFASAHRGKLLSTGRAEIDPSALAGLRDKLVGRLPAAPELERLRLWPWWPWEPWWDCRPDIIFKATQDCGGENKVIVDETVWQTRWDIPTTLNVTLTASDACCIPICTDPNDCPEGDCMVISEACDIPVGNIGGNFGAVAATPEGYVNPGAVSVYGDRPFADNVPISGIFGSGAGVDYYEFEWATTNAGPWNPMPPAASGGFSRQFWGPDLPAGPLGWHYPAFPFTVITGRRVIESREHFEQTNGAGTWGVTRFWGSYNYDLLMNWLTNGNFADGTYYLRVRAWDLVAGNLQNDRILPMCDTEDENYLVLTIDNRVTDGTDGHPAPGTPNHPCGSGTVHLCTMEPDTDIVNVTIGGQVVGPCTNVQAAPGSPLVVDFLAYDQNDHLAEYSLIATYGENLYRDLLSLADSIVPLGGTGVPAAAQVGPDYGAALIQGAASPVWSGGGLRLTINDSSLAFPEPCCYQLELRAYKRTIVGCYGGFAHNNLSEYSFGVNACP